MPSSFRGQLRYAGVIAAIAPLSVLTGCGEANRAEKSAQPGKAQPVTLGNPRLVETPRESPPGVAVSVPVSYTTPKSTRASHRTEVTGRVTVQNGSGRRWELTARPGPDSHRVLPVARGHHTVYSHLFLSDDDARTVQGALGGGGSATVAARAAVATDANGDGKVDSTTATTAMATAKKLTPASQALSDERRSGTRSLGLVGGGPDPCDNDRNLEGGGLREHPGQAVQGESLLGEQRSDDQLPVRLQRRHDRRARPRWRPATQHHHALAPLHRDGIGLAL